MSIEVTVVVVTYNSARYLPDCLGAIAAAVAGIKHETIVVDNASTDATCDLVRQYAPRANLIRNAVNTGFGAANNQALVQGRGTYKLLVNPDAVLWPGSVAALVAYLDGHPRCGLAGPRLHDPDESTQFSVFNFPTPGNQVFESLFLHRLAPGLTTRFGEVVYDRAFYDTNRSVGWVSGAVMILRSAALDTTGLFDERFFMYSEEKDLCYRMHREGWSVDYVSEAHATHAHDGQVTPEAFARQLRSKMQYFDKHHRGLYRLGCKAGLVLGFGTRIVAGAFAALVGSDRSAGLLVPVQGIPLFLRANRDARHQQEVGA